MRRRYIEKRKKRNSARKTLLLILKYRIIVGTLMRRRPSVVIIKRGGCIITKPVKNRRARSNDSARIIKIDLTKPSRKKGAIRVEEQKRVISKFKEYFTSCLPSVSHNVYLLIQKELHRLYGQEMSLCAIYLSVKKNKKYFFD